jgi:protein tyrosine phosphatase
MVSTKIKNKKKNTKKNNTKKKILNRRKNGKKYTKIQKGGGEYDPKNNEVNYQKINKILEELYPDKGERNIKLSAKFGDTYGDMIQEIDKLEDEKKKEYNSILENFRRYYLVLFNNQKPKIIIKNINFFEVLEHDRKNDLNLIKAESSKPNPQPSEEEKLKNIFKDYKDDFNQKSLDIDKKIIEEKTEYDKINTKNDLNSLIVIEKNIDSIKIFIEKQIQKYKESLISISKLSNLYKGTENEALFKTLFNEEILKKWLSNQEKYEMSFSIIETNHILKLNNKINVKEAEAKKKADEEAKKKEKETKKKAEEDSKEDKKKKTTKNTKNQANAVIQTNDIKHFWYRDWPDHGAPNITTPNTNIKKNFIDFVNILLYDIKNNKGGTVIHCSAGVGRTGTLFVILKICLDKNKYLSEIVDGEVTNDEIVAAIEYGRQHRISIVQSQEQYQFINKILLINKTKPIKEFNFINSYETTNNMIKANECKKHNRWGNMFPYDKTRVVLDKIDGDSDECSDYINANYLNTELGTDAGKIEIDNDDNFCGFVIATQCPTPTSKPNFLRMLSKFELNIKRIIMVTNLVEKGAIKCDDYTETNIGNLGLPINKENKDTFGNIGIYKIKDNKLEFQGSIKIDSELKKVSNEKKDAAKIASDKIAADKLAADKKVKDDKKAADDTKAADAKIAEDHKKAAKIAAKKAEDEKKAAKIAAKKAEDEKKAASKIAAKLVNKIINPLVSDDKKADAKIVEDKTKQEQEKQRKEQEKQNQKQKLTKKNTNLNNQKQIDLINELIKRIYIDQSEIDNFYKLSLYDAYINIGPKLNENTKTNENNRQKTREDYKLFMEFYNKSIDEGKKNTKMKTLLIQPQQLSFLSKIFTKKQPANIVIDPNKIDADEAKKLADEKIAVKAKKLADEKIAAEAKKLADEKIASDKIAADKIAADKIAADKIAADKIAADKIIAAKIAANEKLAAEKAADEKKAAEANKDDDNKPKIGWDFEGVVQLDVKPTINNETLRKSIIDTEIIQYKLNENLLKFILSIKNDFYHCLIFNDTYNKTTVNDILTKYKLEKENYFDSTRVFNNILKEDTKKSIKINYYFDASNYNLFSLRDSKITFLKKELKKIYKFFPETLYDRYDHLKDLSKAIGTLNPIIVDVNLVLSDDVPIEDDITNIKVLTYNIENNIKDNTKLVNIKKILNDNMTNNVDFICLQEFAYVYTKLYKINDVQQKHKKRKNNTDYDSYTFDSTKGHPFEKLKKEISPLDASFKNNMNKYDYVYYYENPEMQFTFYDKTKYKIVQTTDGNDLIVNGKTSNNTRPFTLIVLNKIGTEINIVLINVHFPHTKKFNNNSINYFIVKAIKNHTLLENIKYYLKKSRIIIAGDFNRNVYSNPNKDTFFSNKAEKTKSKNIEEIDNSAYGLKLFSGLFDDDENTKNKSIIMYNIATKANTFEKFTNGDRHVDNVLDSFGLQHKFEYFGDDHSIASDHTAVLVRLLDATPIYDLKDLKFNDVSDISDISGISGVNAINYCYP